MKKDGVIKIVSDNLELADEHNQAIVIIDGVVYFMDKFNLELAIEQNELEVINITKR